MSMQKILNSQERTQAFFKFLLFFLITVTLVVIAVYFNFRLPLKENKKLQEQMAIQRAQDIAQGKFIENMNVALAYLDSLDKDTKNQEQIGMLLEGSIKDLFKLQEKGNSPYAKLNQVIAFKLTDLKNQKIQLNKLSDKNNTMRDLENKLQVTESQLMEAQRQLDVIRRSN